MTQSDWRAMALLTLLVAATSIPFLHRAYFVDDYYHVTMARGLLTHPTRPYDFVADDEAPGNKGWERGHFPRMVNPPLFHYFLAAVMTLWGDAVWKLRAASLVFAWISVLCVYGLGRRFVQHPLAAAALLAVTPAFWLTEYSLLLDGAQLAFFLAAFWVFIAGLEKRRIRLILASGLLMGLTMLVKYFGVLIVPVALVWQWSDPERRRWRPGYAAYIVAGAVLLAWGFWNIATYGQMHLLATLPRGFQGRTPPLAYLGKILVLGSFIGGTFIFVSASPLFLWRRSSRLVMGLVVLALALLGLLISPRGGFPLGSALLMTFFTFSAAAFAVRASQDASDSARFLNIWWWIGVAELIAIMPWTAGRYLLLILPPTIWIVQHWIEDSGARALGIAMFIGTALVSTGLAFADYAQANVIVSVSDVLSKLPVPPSVGQRYYLGDTFSGYDATLGPLGWKSAFPTTDLKHGDWLLVPLFRTSSWWVLPHPERLRPISTYDFPSRWPLRVMDVPDSAGFYASCWGALPFVLTHHSLEKFVLYEVQ